MAYRPEYRPPGESISWMMKWLDGDRKKVSLVDTVPDGGVNYRVFLSGKPVLPDHMPTQLYPDRRQKIYPDYFTGGAGLVVSEKFRSVVEELEPGVHQFFPIDIVTKKDRNLLEKMFILIICNRIDAVHGEKSNRVWYGDKLWAQKRDLDRDWKGEDILVLDRAKIGQHHLWFDKHLSMFDGPLMSNQLKDALEAAGMHNVIFFEIAEG